MLVDVFSIAQVAVQTGGPAGDTLYSYLIPPELTAQCQTGSRVIVPFGRANRKLPGMVLSVSEQEGTPEILRRIKYIYALADAEPCLNEEQVKLVFWLRENTFCTYYDAVRTVLPAALQLRIEQSFVLHEDVPADSLSVPAQQFLEVLRAAHSQQERDGLLTASRTPEKRRLVEELTAAGIVSLTCDVKPRVQPKKVRMVRVLPETETPVRLSAKLRGAAETLREYEALTEKEFCYICGITAPSVKKLAQEGVIERFDAEPPPKLTAGESSAPLTLSPAQQQVYDRIAPAIDAQRAKCFLLRGVTGSGKTAVFEALIQHTLEQGRSAILLLPEIGLTPQTVSRFAARFGDVVAVVHSALPLSERRQSYERAVRGQAKIIIGTRSAVFTPVQNLGLIIMDEEGERFYKSEAAPRYDTIQVAKQRCLYHNAVLLPASATPTLESYYHARKGIYELVELTERYQNVPLPSVETVDMSLERQAGNESEFSFRLTEALTETLGRGEQAILLLNRRGYHTLISCCRCNQPVCCENCSVPMTYHRSDDLLHCHYCGAVRPVPANCPSCGNVKLRRMGFGTQRLEEELAVRFPQARLLRMDADTTGPRFAYEKGFEAFRKGEYDILLGTQMIGKGLDFPNVTLVGVMSVDKALFAGDYRSYERTFSLITQVVGRGGRSGKAGRAILQTFLPDHYVLRLAAQQDYVKFYEEELSIRRALLYPPFCDILTVSVSAGSPEEAEAGARAFIVCMQDVLQKQTEKPPLRVLGPVPFNYVKICGKYRWRIIIKCKNTKQFRDLMRDVMRYASGFREIARSQISFDLNGSTGL